MSTLTENRPWDFSQVLEFANAFSPTCHSPALATATISTSAAAGNGTSVAPSPSAGGAGVVETANYDSTLESPALGNFHKVWQFLGVSTTPSVSTKADALTSAIPPAKDDYASDGAAYKSKDSVIVLDFQWTDGTDREDTGSATSTGTPMSKTQRKRAKRKLRKAAQAHLPVTAGMVSESEAEHVARQTPARKAATHVVRSITPSQYARAAAVHLKPLLKSEQDSHGTATTHAKQSESVLKSIPVPTSSVSQRQTHRSFLSDEDAQKAIEAVAKATAAIKSQQHDATTGSRSSQVTTRPAETPAASCRPGSTAVPQQKQPSTPVTSKLTLVPASVLSKPKTQPSTPRQPSNMASPNSNSASHVSSAQQSRLHISSQTPGGTFNKAMVPSPLPARRAKPPSTIEPHIIRSGEDRHWALLIKIIGDFYEDRKHLVAPMTLTTHNNHPDGIHLFVDASNIFIGFMNQLKLARGIHPLHQMPQANLSFDGLALLMERRRPVARRVLVGSNPHLPAFDKAAAVGYECNILEKVYKARELTERQIYFRESDARRFGRPNKMTPGPNTVAANGFPAASYGAVVGGSGNTPKYDPPKYIEQGVDEILHLKMMQSVVDAERPSTMVLATGDAAAAEYSDGFMANVERALKKGWKVELISWSKSISSMYTKKPWMAQWGDRFRIIFLDDYAEELLDMDGGSSE